MICDTHKWEKVATRGDEAVWYCPNCGCTRDMPSRKDGDK